jgi:hypothetical protein
MKNDSLRNFTVRFLDSVLHRVESTAKSFYGGRLSTGEAIRRLAEERLDEIERAKPHESHRDSLLRMLRAWRSGHTLALSDLRLLAQSANEAYQRSQHLVARDLLVANVSAFRDAVRLSTQGKNKTIEPDAQYFVGNFITREPITARTLTEYADRWIAQLADRPNASQASFASRNLYAYLRDEEYSNAEHLEKTLAQYVPALLQLAIRNYWYEQRIALIEPAKGPQPHEPPRSQSRIQAGRVAIDPWLGAHDVSASILLTPSEWGFALRNFVELEELVAVTRLAGSGAEDLAQDSMFKWIVTREKPKHYILHVERAWFALDFRDFESLTECLESLLQEPSVAAVIERMPYVYGRI